MEQGKLIIFSAPSGSGKSTIIDQLTSYYGLEGRFSISATSRAPRGEEQNGVHYHFLTTEDFRQRIERGEFLEHEEVYEGVYYGTLKSEVDLTLQSGENIILDIDVKGAMNIKKVYGDQALTIFIQPPSIEVLRERLESRGTDAPEKIAERLAKAETELSYAPYFDKKIINDQLHSACGEAIEFIQRFIRGEKRVLLFPGSFSPMHIGHLAIANFAAEAYEKYYDEVWFLLTPISPFKKEWYLLPTDFRADWIEHLIETYPKFRLKRDEEELEPPHYTYNTVRYLKEKYPSCDFTLLIGADSLQDLPKWYESEQLIDEIKIVAYPRPGYDLSQILPEYKERIKILEDVPIFEISSTQLRELIREGHALPYLLGSELSNPLYRRLHEEILKRSE